jgi:hypothetical protein
MMKKLLLLGCLCLCPVVQAETTDLWSVGHGFSQGGLLGVQYQSVAARDKFTAAIGLVGAGIGWQHAMDADGHHTLGLSGGYEAIVANQGFAGMTYNYYPNGFAKRGWHFGVFGGVAREKYIFPVFYFSQSETLGVSSYEKSRSRGVAALEIGFQY